jgi:hypothetical protein
MALSTRHRRGQERFVPWFSRSNGPSNRPVGAATAACNCFKRSLKATQSAPPPPENPEIGGTKRPQRRDTIQGKTTQDQHALCLPCLHIKR